MSGNPPKLAGLLASESAESGVDVAKVDHFRALVASGQYECRLRGLSDAILSQDLDMFPISGRWFRES